MRQVSLLSIFLLCVTWERHLADKNPRFKCIVYKKIKYIMKFFSIALKSIHDPCALYKYNPGAHLKQICFNNKLQRDPNKRKSLPFPSLLQLHLLWLTVQYFFLRVYNCFSTLELNKRTFVRYFAFCKFSRYVFLLLIFF